LITKENSQIIRSLENFKQLRNAIYGLTRYCFALYLYPGSKVKRQYIRTNLQNLDLLVIIASLLHNLVYPYWDGILYWNIDGGIVKAEIFEQLKRDIEELEFELEVIEQDSQVEILGLGSYAIGNFTTAHYEHKVQAKNEFKENIYKVINDHKIKSWFRRK
jgi:coproporphyrinogen III oxidase-like Fe-S oxidoreductase